MGIFRTIFEGQARYLQLFEIRYTHNLNLDLLRILHLGETQNKEH